MAALSATSPAANSSRSAGMRQREMPNTSCKSHSSRRAQLSDRAAEAPHFLSTARRRLGASWRQNIIYLGFVGIFIFFAITLHEKGFLEATNLLNIIRQTAVIAVMA